MNTFTKLTGVLILSLGFYQVGSATEAYNSVLGAVFFTGTKVGSHTSRVTKVDIPEKEEDIAAIGADIHSVACELESIRETAIMLANQALEAEKEVATKYDVIERNSNNPAWTENEINKVLDTEENREFLRNHAGILEKYSRNAKSICLTENWKTCTGKNYSDIRKDLKEKTFMLTVNPDPDRRAMYTLLEEMSSVREHAKEEAKKKVMAELLGAEAAFEKAINERERADSKVGELSFESAIRSIISTKTHGKNHAQFLRAGKAKYEARYKALDTQENKQFLKDNAPMLERYSIHAGIMCLTQNWMNCTGKDYSDILEDLKYAKTTHLPEPELNAIRTLYGQLKKIWDQADVGLDPALNGALAEALANINLAISTTGTDRDWDLERIENKFKNHRRGLTVPPRFLAFDYL